MPVFDIATLTRYYQTGENEISTNSPFLVDRIAIPIVANQPNYTLPDYVISIRRLTYLGQGLDPLPRRNQREVFQGATQVSTPFWYIYNNIGLNNIKLFPTPPSSINIPSGNLWQGPAIRTGVIVEFYRLTDYTNFIIPPTLRRQLLKQYVGMRAYGAEGPSQNIKVSDYFRDKWNNAKQEFYEWVNVIYNQPRRLIINDYNNFQYFPGSPVLPINQFGISVETGE